MCNVKDYILFNHKNIGSEIGSRLMQYLIKSLILAIRYVTRSYHHAVYCWHSRVLKSFESNYCFSALLRSHYRAKALMRVMLTLDDWVQLLMRQWDLSLHDRDRPAGSRYLNSWLCRIPLVRFVTCLMVHHIRSRFDRKVHECSVVVPYCNP